MQATHLTFSDPPPLDALSSSAAALGPPLPSTRRVLNHPIALHCPLPPLVALSPAQLLALCPLPPSSHCVVSHLIVLYRVLCCPIALHHLPAAHLALSASPPLIMFYAARLPCLPPTYFESI